MIYFQLPIALVSFASIAYFIFHAIRLQQSTKSIPNYSSTDFYLNKSEEEAITQLNLDENAYRIELTESLKPFDITRENLQNEIAKLKNKNSRTEDDKIQLIELKAKLELVGKNRHLHRTRKSKSITTLNQTKQRMKEKPELRLNEFIESTAEYAENANQKISAYMAPILSLLMAIAFYLINPTFLVSIGSTLSAPEYLTIAFSISVWICYYLLNRILREVPHLILKRKQPEVFITLVENI